MEMRGSGPPIREARLRPVEAPENREEDPQEPPPDGAAPELPDDPLGVPAGADEDDEELPGFLEDAGNAG